MRKLMVLVVGMSVWGCSRPPEVTPAQWVERLNSRRAVDAAQTLSRQRTPEVEAALLTGLKHTSARVRSQCARILGERLDVTYSDRLLTCLSDPDDTVRRQAAKALVGLLETDLILEVLQSPDLAKPG